LGVLGDERIEALEGSVVVGLESRAEERTCRLGIAPFDHRQHEVVVFHVQVGSWIQRVGELGLGIGKACQRVEKQLEPGIVGGEDDGPGDLEVAMSETHGVVGVGTGILDGEPDGLEVLVGSADAGEGERFDGDHATDFEQIDEIGTPGGVGGVAFAQEEGECFRASGLSPVGDDGAGAVTDDDETEGLESGECSAEGEAVDAEVAGEVAFGGEAMSDGESAEEDFFSEGDDEAVGDGSFVEGLGEDERRHLIEWFNQ